ncbi:MAG: SagB/ThcOx family dehydrogenase [Gammaproteobacteria bacterium]|nr:SagB/ThcOx family dehydrogenase [Gammaproteobacteria bacterium]MBU0788494.1 SagB/ThcOx family dehydrogenase [Gammaproteobacteria bacterium]MBU0815682.1 SagB/ThcOx family dehydrogenase [Gammaproteobacteria bacterium]MBU1788110.1 SagB/ThcOx family dehydrogenase [Gammaproteobacteria bacterium]
MNTLTKLALGLMGQLKPKPAQEAGGAQIILPPVATGGGMPLLEALQQRQSQRTFATTALSEQHLSELLWAAAGVNRPPLGGRTAPSALNSQEIDVYVALPTGLYLYNPVVHALKQVRADDVRRVTGYQDFVDTAALDLVYVLDHSRMKLVPAAQRQMYGSVAAGAMAQNVYLYCASAGLSTVIRAWIDRGALSEAIGLQTDHEVLLAQTVGNPKAA